MPESNQKNKDREQNFTSDSKVTDVMKHALEVLAQPAADEVVHGQENTHDPKISVNDVVSRLAFMYEKIRNTVDYKDEHLLRKNAMKRILKRILVIENRKKDLGRYLIKELIRARYLPNNTIPESKGEEVSVIIEKYIVLHKALVSSTGAKFITRSNNQESSLKWLDWLLGIAAYQIDEEFFPRLKEEVVLDLMRHSMEQKISFSEELVDRENITNHLTIAIRRTLIKADSDLLNYFILKTRYPDWFDNKKGAERAEEIARGIPLLDLWLKNLLDHPLQEYFYQICKKNLAPFLILEDVFSANIDKTKALFKEPENLEHKIRELTDRRYQGISERLRRSATRSVLYIFFTKVTLALVLELPYELYYIEHINYINLGINILFPPLLMIALVINVKAPSEKNTQKIIWEIMDLAYNKKRSEIGNEGKAVYRIKSSVLRNESFFDSVFNVFYMAMFLVPLVVVVWLLYRFDFNLISGGIFIFYLSAISFFSTRLRVIARELLVVDSKEGIIAIFQDFFFLPFIRLGRWLSLKFSKINVLVFILDFIIEAPFKTLIEVFEQWIMFLRRKREEIY